MSTPTTTRILFATTIAAATWLATPTTALGQKQTAEPFPYVFQIERNDSPASFAFLNDKEAGADGFVRVQGDHFATEKGRIRFWGVNLCFGANFPTHEDAEKLAKRLSHFGINAVRIHHHETQFSPDGLYKSDGTIDPQQMDRLDFLFAELHKRGIYVNINLHVGRSVVRQKKMPELSSSYSASGDKHALLFMPEIQEAFWQYCRDYLGRENPYRKMRRNRDPGIAMIEILNENRFSREGPRYLKAAPEPYRTEILKRWNAWLREQYKDDAGLRAAWQPEGDEAGPSIADSRSMTGSGKAGAAGGNWFVQDNGGKSPVTYSTADGAIRIEPQEVAEENWHQQLAAERLTLKKDALYSFEFEVRADAEKTVNYNAATVEGGWRQLGLGGQVTAKPDWQKVSVTFSANDTVEGKARLAFDLGGNKAAIEFRNIVLRPGANWIVLPEGQSVTEDSVELPDSNWAPKAQAAAVAFMQDLEREFYNKTRKLIRDELGMTVPICATQVNYIGAKLADELGDFTDLHSYWNHPLFPGREWDPSHWVVTHEPIEADPFSNKWPRNSPLMRGAWRVHGKPFTYSEWNTGEPSLPSAGGVPIMALMASLQDWDAIFFFDFEDASGRWDSNRLEGFFRMNSQPCKLALLGPFGQLYRRNHLAAIPETHASAEGAHLEDGVLGFEKRIGLDPKLDRVTGNSPPESSELEEQYPPLLQSQNQKGGKQPWSAKWDARDKKKAKIKVNTPFTKAAWGLIGGQTLHLDDWRVTIGDVPADYGVFIATSRDGLPLKKSRSILITIVNHSENSTMPWNAEGDSLGSRWGEGPTVTWGVPAKIILERETKLTVTALDASGNPIPDSQNSIPIKEADAGKYMFEVGSDNAPALSYWLRAE